MSTPDTAMFGPEYPKIQTLWKRDERNVVIVGDHSTPEFKYLFTQDWVWTEKVDGTNIRLHWNGEKVTIGGRTDNAQVPSPLVANLAPQLDPDLWRSIFPDADNVTVYGEGYGAKIQSGGMYRPDQALIVFDVLVDRWWLSEDNVTDVATKLGLEVVPTLGTFSLQVAWFYITQEEHPSRWADARIEGYVGRPAVDLFNRKGERIMAKVKVKDWADHQRRGGRVLAAEQPGGREHHLMATTETPEVAVRERVFMTIEWDSQSPEQDSSLVDEITDDAASWLEGYDPKFLGPTSTVTLEQAFHWSEGERARVENENERLRSALDAAVANSTILISRMRMHGASTGKDDHLYGVCWPRHQEAFDALTSGRKENRHDDDL